MKNKLKEMRGITLIALVITIIVLLILAGVSIATLTGENGLLTQAQSSKTANKKAEAEEIFKLIANEWQIEKRTNKNADLKDFLTTKKTEYGDKLTVSDEAPYTLEYNGEKIQIDNNGTLTEVVGNEKPNTLEPGLYDASYNLKMTWAELIESGDLTVVNGILSAETDIPGILVVDSSVNAIGVFESCGELIKIIIPNSVTDIYNDAFMSCKDLISIEIPNTITKINEYVFSNCQSLAHITIPDSVTSFGIYSFESCNDLASIDYSGTKAQWNAIQFEDGWNEGCPKITVKCTDGDIEIPAYGQ